MFPTAGGPASPLGSRLQPQKEPNRQSHDAAEAEEDHMPVVTRIMCFELPAAHGVVVHAARDLEPLKRHGQGKHRWHVGLRQQPPDEPQHEDAERGEPVLGEKARDERRPYDEERHRHKATLRARARYGILPSRRHASTLHSS